MIIIIMINESSNFRLDSGGLSVGVINHSWMECDIIGSFLSFISMAPLSTYFVKHLFH